jgi:hypothetical protein
MGGGYVKSIVVCGLSGLVWEPVMYFTKWQLTSGGLESGQFSDFLSCSCLLRMEFATGGRKNYWTSVS